MNLPKFLTCPKCVEEKLTSKVYYDGTSGTGIAPPRPYWDEEGRYHEHNPNVYKHAFRCSRQHFWMQEERLPCPTCG